MKTMLSVLLSTLALSVTAQADHRDVNPLDRLRHLAYELERASDRIADSADSCSHPWDDHRGEERQIRRLYALAAAASDLRQELEGCTNVWEAEARFRQVTSLFTRAKDNLRILHAYDRVYDDFCEVERLIDAIDDVFHDAASQRRVRDRRYRAPVRYEVTRVRSRCD